MYFFFFKQKTAYEISLGLVGSEMCIRDRYQGEEINPVVKTAYERELEAQLLPRVATCLLYTSDAADEPSSVDLGGRRIIKKKTLSSLPLLPLGYQVSMRCVAQSRS